MPGEAFKPWGPLDWVLPRVKKSSWCLIGCNSVEERSLATLRFSKAQVSRSRFFCIQDPDPFDGARFESLTEKYRKELISLGVSEANIPKVNLMADLDVLRDQLEECLGDNQTKNVLLDISALPKRWFFSLTQMLLADARIETLVITYASPAKYGEILAENPEPIRVLPGFFDTEGRTEHDILAVGIGFEPLGLSSLFGDLSIASIRLLFPFPPGPPGFGRNWMFVKSIDDMTKDRGIESLDRIQLHMHDCPQIFAALNQMTKGGDLRMAMAPYGPKPMSLAMCLFALAAIDAGKPRVPLYYAQPKRYMPDYSTGIREINGKMDIQAYCVKLNSVKLYQLT